MFSIEELNRYSTTVRRKFAEKLASMPAEAVERDREASFHSMKNIMLHMIDNEDWMVNYVVEGRSGEYKRRSWGEYSGMDMVIGHLNEVEAKTARFMKGVDAGKLSSTVTFRTSKGNDISMTVEECLFQSFTEQLYHMGELIALMWQDEIEPPAMQWFYNSPRSG